MTADELVTFAEDLSRISAAGGGPKALADRLSRATGCSVLVEDAEWRHVAAAGRGLPSSVRTLVTPAAEKTLAPLRDGRPGRTMSISNGDLRLGQISIFGDGDLDRHLHPVRLAAGSIGVELARDAVGQPARRRAFWERLVSGEYVDASAARDDAAARGIALATHYVAIAIEPEIAAERPQSTDHAAIHAVAAQVFRIPDADTGTIERANTIFVLAPAPREIDSANARTAATLLPRTLAKKDSYLRTGVGVGTRAPIIETPISVDRAHAALMIARRMFGSGKAGVYDELGAYPLLLEGAPPDQLRRFAADTLAPLRAYDEKHQTELQRTLQLYFSVGENVKTAATQLNVHRHTVFYRLRQIAEICACKLDDPHDQLTLRMAIAIDALNA